jgi:hypothetical protein
MALANNVPEADCWPVQTFTFEEPLTAAVSCPRSWRQFFFNSEVQLDSHVLIDQELPRKNTLPDPIRAAGIGSIDSDLKRLWMKDSCNWICLPRLRKAKMTL